MKLIDENVAPLVLIFAADSFVCAQEQDGAHQEVVEVHGVVQLEELLVAAVDAVANLLHVAIGADQVRRKQIVLPVADLCQDRPGAEAFLVEPHLLENFAHESQLVGAVVDHPVAFEAGGLDFDAQDACADGVEGADGEAAEAAAAALDRRGEPVADQLFNPTAHFACGLVGKGNGQDVPRVDLSLFDQIDDALGQDACFA